MREVKELKIENPQNIYKEIADALIPYRDRELYSVEFIVEGSIDNPIVGIRYPGEKVGRRPVKTTRRNIARWKNLLDFVVIPYIGGKAARQEDFTFEKIAKDFELHKRNSDEFWRCVEEIYRYNELKTSPPSLQGIDSLLFLLVLKWMWIQEDLNYKLSWKDIGASIPYTLETKKGKPTKKGAGRA